MRNSQGYAQIIGPGLPEQVDPGLASLNKLGECDTYTCGHCQRVTHVPVQVDPANCGALCRTCDTLICAHCASLKVCYPFEQKLQEQLDRLERMRSLGF